VAKLEARGLVGRTVDDRDRRVKWVAISPEGQRQLDASRTRRTAWLATRLADMSADDLARLAAILPILDALAEPDAPEPDAPGRPPR
jgi:DNA-binding MarR family transcriptional regulator